MKAFDVFRLDFYKEFPKNLKGITPTNIRSLSIDDFDGRIMNDFKHIKK